MRWQTGCSKLQRTAHITPSSTHTPHTPHTQRGTSLLRTTDELDAHTHLPHAEIAQAVRTRRESQEQGEGEGRRLGRKAQCGGRVEGGGGEASIDE